MGNVEGQIEKVRFLVMQLKKEIPSSKFFELGDDQRKLEKIDRQLKRLSELLTSLRDYYAPLPLSESNHYLQVLTFAEETQEFITNIHGTRRGSSQNTAHFLALLHKLENSIALLAPQQGRISQDKPKSLQETKDLVVAASKTTTSSNKLNRVPVENVKSRFFLTKILGSVFVFFPRAVGQAILDLVGRGQAASTTALLLGYALITTIVLIIWGFWDLDKIVGLIKDIRGSQ